ncbi:beta-glucosidase [Saitozyma sp. JCM 24511]|nr:beta-glucosidase [Saitozyma sp. JCM 24511]
MSAGTSQTPRAVLPKGFQYGYATAAWQIEGGSKEDGRGPCVWDDFASIPGAIVDGATGDVAVDSYHLWREDVKLLTELGATAYRFSISWSRVVPLGGRNDPINDKGLEYYSNLVDALLDAGIAPYVTLFHWDLPSALEKRYGGWSNSDEVTKDFERFARVIFAQLGDRVKHWITLNEPFIILRNSSRGVKPNFDWNLDTWRQASPVLPPGIGLTMSHRIPRAMVLAHARAVKAYRDDFQRTLGGDIGICLVSSAVPRTLASRNAADRWAENCDWFEPLGDDPLAPIACQARRDTYLGMYADPIYLGHFPQLCKDTAGDRLQDFTSDEWAIVQGSSDCFYLNTYSTHWLTGEPLTDHTAEMYGGYLSTQFDAAGKVIGKPGEPGHLKMVPWGFRKIIQYLQNKYLGPTGTPLIISENGFAPAGEHTKRLPDVLQDDERIEYFQGYLGQMVEAVSSGGIDIKGYFAWSLLDNLEWV